MTKASNIAAIEKTTGKEWTEWVAFLDDLGGKDLPHKEIAEKVREQLKSHESGSWWAQSITVAYEQHIGRRKPGQRSDGTYEVSVTKTRPGNMDDAMKVWLVLVHNRQKFSGQAITKLPTMTQTDKRHHWTCALADGSRVNADVYKKSADKVTLAITHQKLTNKKAVEKWRDYWKAELAKI